MSEPTFLEFVENWDRLVADIEAAKKSLKKLTDREMPLRRAIADAVNEALPNGLREGVNNFPLPNGRKLKVTHKIDRKIEEAEITAVREEYSKLNDRPVDFDNLLRVKYELSKVEWDKLGDEANKIVARMIVSKPAAPVVVLD